MKIIKISNYLEKQLANLRKSVKCRKICLITWILLIVLPASQFVSQASKRSF